MTARLISVLAVAGLGALPTFAQDAGTGQFISSVPDENAFDGGGYTSTDGETLYATFCAGCHMPEGEGASGAGDYPALRENRNLEFAAYPITLIVNGQGGMPSLGHLLSDEQVLQITNFIQSNLGNGYTPDGTLQMVADTRPVEEQEVLAEHEIEEEEDDNVDPDREDAAEGGGGNEAVSPDSMDAASGSNRGTATESDDGEDGGGVVRHRIPNSDFPILLAAEIPADATLVYLSGTVPQVIDADADQGSPERYGDTAAQTESTLASIEQKLAALDLDMGDVVKMQVYLVAPEGEDAMDFGGFMEGYVRYFGTEAQPELPTRSVFEVAGLANPSWLVEIEVVAVRP